jgi:TRAP-type C4-dicarboxylate transport system permease small subunit
MQHSEAAEGRRNGPIGWYVSALRFLAGASMLAIVAIMSAQVFARYVLGWSLIWAEEICRYILIWQTFLFVGLAYTKGEMVAVDVVPLMLPPRWRLALKALVSIPILAFLWLMMVNGYDYSTRFAHQIVPGVDYIFISLTGRGVGLSIFWVYVSVAIGCLLLGLHIIASLVVDWRGLPNAPNRPAPTEAEG